MQSKEQDKWMNKIEPETCIHETDCQMSERRRGSNGERKAERLAKEHLCGDGQGGAVLVAQRKGILYVQPSQKAGRIT